MNIAGGSRATIQQVLQLLQEISGTTINITYGKKQYGDVRDTFADMKGAEKVSGYHPLVSLREGLANEFEDILSLYKQAHTRIV